MAGAKGRAITYVNGDWLEGNPGLFGPMTHSAWLSSIVFDGARAFDGVAPDLDRHCLRTVNSALALGLQPTLAADEILDLSWQGIRQFASGASLYIRPMFYAEQGFVDPDPESTRFCLSVYESPFPEASGATAALASYRRPSPETAPTAAKASCLYPQAGLALQEVKRRGYSNAIMLDPMGHVAEFATANLFVAQDGVVTTPVPNGTFLNGITRQRVIALLRGDGVEVVERTMTMADVLDADELFSTGNYGKVVAFSRVEDRDLQPGPLFARARELYWDFAHSLAKG